MRSSLAIKLILSSLTTSVLGVVLVAVYSRAVSASEFDRLIRQRALTDFSADVIRYYRANGTLEGVGGAIGPRASQPGGDQPLPENPPPAGLPPAVAGPLVRFGLADPNGKVVLSGDGYTPGEQAPPEAFKAGAPILLDSQVIAVALWPKNPPVYSQIEAQYVARTTQALILGGGGAILIAVLLGALLARTITRPLRELTGAAGRLAKGELGQKVAIRSQDEVGELAAAFNRMSDDLAHADRARRQMTADIAHELRNPLTVITGYIDVMQAGDVPATPERLDILQHEAQHLNRLVDDLRTLSLADVGALSLSREPISAHELLQHIAEVYRQQAEQQEVALITDAHERLPQIEVDIGRMKQVLGNLVSNALRYTPAGGRVSLAAEAHSGDAVLLKVQDTGSGISPDELPYIFERFYRADKSRQEHQGGSGLGLAIAKAIVEAHGGLIWAESDIGRGTRFMIRLGVI